MGIHSSDCTLTGPNWRWVNNAARTHFAPRIRLKTPNPKGLGSLSTTRVWNEYRIVNQNGSTTFRTDLYSRAQIGCGDVNPMGAPYPGPAEALDGVVSCSLVVDMSVVRGDDQNGGPASAATLFVMGAMASPTDPRSPLPTVCSSSSCRPAASWCCVSFR